MILLDTNILIEVLKNNRKIVEFLNGLEDEVIISSITQMELFYGAFNKMEIKKLEKFFLNFEIVYIDEEISKIATNLVKKYSKSHNLNIPDSLIAATAIKKNCYLCTLNLKDFKYLDKIKLLEV
ncbi:type II toxin-antitoxin system VapC family toxin [Nitrosophilus labii]|uniref:type II toxin-antitoxin system VapC family toxin n=1 Tax=Nitrosophilus labii TaxID=2706014 RepID=UPI00165696B7